MMRLIVCTGPESSGKTTLAQALAGELQILWTPEFARFYLSGLGGPYEYDDLQAISRGQSAWENWYVQQNAAKGHAMTVCDTDWTVLHIWEKWKYGTTYITPADNMPIHDRFYLLCRPDMDWTPDPLREHPHEREALFQAYEQLLINLGADFRVVGGPLDVRVNLSLSEIRR